MVDGQNFVNQVNGVPDSRGVFLLTLMITIYVRTLWSILHFVRGSIVFWWHCREGTAWPAPFLPILIYGGPKYQISYSTVNWYSPIFCGQNALCSTWNIDITRSSIFIVGKVFGILISFACEFLFSLINEKWPGGNLYLHQCAATARPAIIFSARYQ